MENQYMELTQRLLNIYSQKGLSKATVSAAKYVLPHPTDALVEMAEVEAEKRHSVSLPLKRRLEMLNQGFQSHQYYLYGFNSDKVPKNYLDEYQRKAYTRQINNTPELLNNKKKFHEMMVKNGFDEFVPEIFGTINNGEFKREKNLMSYLNQEESLVLKPVKGAAGNGVMVCELVENGIRINDKHRSIEEFTDIIEGLSAEVLVTEYIEQDDYSNEIFPGSTNTIRVLMMQPDNDDPFIASAVQRIGSRSTSGLDNFSQGGFSADINIETGKMGKAGRPQPDGSVNWHELHPDTERQIEGIQVPGWNQIRDRLLKIHHDLPLRYIAWDIVVTNPGEFVLIEGNNRSDVDVYQIHGPLLTDNRVQNFYADHDVDI